MTITLETMLSKLIVTRVNLGNPNFFVLTFLKDNNYLGM